MRRCLLAALALLAAVPAGALAQRCVRPDAALPEPPAVLIVMDASRSMAKDAGDGRSRLEVAKAALRAMVEDLPDEAQVGLRLYGHRFSDTTKARGCTDTELVQPVGPLEREALLGQIDAYDAKGFTPIGPSLRAAADDLPAGRPGTIVLVSDGGDTCAPPGPCAVAGELRAGGTTVAIQAVGFQVTPRARRQLECIAERGGGTYVDAADSDALTVALRALAARPARRFEARGAAVRGGEDLRRAVPVREGRSTATLAPGGSRFFRVRAGRGQRLAATASLVATCALPGSVGTTVSLTAYGPDGRPLGRPHTGEVQPSLFSFASFGAESVGLLTAPLAATGDHVVEATLADPGGELEGSGELALELAVDLADEPPRPAGREPTPAPPGEVAGSGSYLGAPVLAPGRHTDTLVANEGLLYGIRAQPGQTIEVRARVDAGSDLEDVTAPLTQGVEVSLDLLTPLLQDTDGRTLLTRGEKLLDGTIALQAPVLGRAAADRAAGEGFERWTGPGTWYLRLAASGEPRRPVVELPVALDVRVTGGAESQPGIALQDGPDPLGLAGRAPAAAAPAPAEAADDGGTPPAVVGGAAAAVVLLVLALLLRRRLRGT